MLRSSIGSRFVVAFSLAFLFPPLLPGQVPVIPNAAGWGIETPAGRGGTILRVTNLNANGSGSLANALSQNGPRVIIFEVSGTIVLTDWLFIDNPNVTVAGQTAPSPGITIRGGGIRVRTHDVLIQHLRVRVGDGQGPGPEQRDCLEILANNQNCYNVVVDHCSFSWGIDENVSIYSPNNRYTNHDITIRYCIISEGLLNSLHPEGTHSMGLLIGGNSGGRHDNITFIGNLMAHNNQRNPMSQSRELVHVNNLAYNWGEYAATLLSEGDINKTSAVGNVFLSGRNSSSRWAPFTLSRYLRSGSQIYLSDNLAPGYSDIYNNWASFNPIVNNPPVWPEGLVALPSGVVEDDVLDNAGSRPSDRDAVDIRIVSDVVNGTGALINSQSNVGGWPVLAVNTRSLTTPSNPHGDSDGDGYTNLEEWLQGYSADVGGDGGGGGGGGGSTVTLLTENFDGGNIPGSTWRHGDNNGTSGQDYWDDQSASSGARVHSGSSSLYCSDIGGYPGQLYDNDMDAYFELNQGLDISGYEIVTVRFWVWYKIRASGDYATFEYLSGSNWVELERWSGLSNPEEWTEYSYPIPSNAGSTLFFRWFMHSDGSGRREGIYIDDVVVEGVQPGAARGIVGEEGRTGVQDPNLSPNSTAIPGEFQLGQNYPNPFNPSTAITFSIAEDAYTTLIVFDILGREVARLIDGWMAAGNHSVLFRASDLANGIYLYRLESEGHRDIKRMMLLK